MTQHSRPPRAWRNWALLGEALALHVIVKLGLRVLACQHLQAFLESMTTFSAKKLEAREIVRAVRAAARPVGGATCLADALVAYTMLNRRGHASRICFGVRRGDAHPLEGHAWVECDGVVVIGDVPELARYAMLA